MQKIIKDEKKEEEKVWRKILYEIQPFPDNYVDREEFLKGLIVNANLTPLRFSSLVRDSVAISCQISFVVLFLLAFHLILYDKVFIFKKNSF